MISWNRPGGFRSELEWARRLAFVLTADVAVVVFTHAGPRLDNVMPTMTAFGRDGRKLGEAHLKQ